MIALYWTNHGEHFSSLHVMVPLSLPWVIREVRMDFSVLRGEWSIVKNRDSDSVQQIR